MIDKYKRDTKHISIRLSASIKSKLNMLAKIDDTTQTETLKRLINAAYKAREDEIKEFRENLKNRENSRETE
jgi:predicted DNA-binding protein